MKWWNPNIKFGMLAWIGFHHNLNRRSTNYRQLLAILNANDRSAQHDPRLQDSNTRPESPPACEIPLSCPPISESPRKQFCPLRCFFCFCFRLFVLQKSFETQDRSAEANKSIQRTMSSSPPFLQCRTRVLTFALPHKLPPLILDFRFLKNTPPIAHGTIATFIHALLRIIECI